MDGPPAPRKPLRYRLYVDESGDHAYRNLDKDSHRYLALLGVWFKQPDEYADFSDGLDALKRAIWGPRPDTPIILHRSEIINRKGPFGVLRDPAHRKSFDQRLLELVEAAKFRMVCVVIDKKAQQERYIDLFHPYHFSMAVLLERYVGWMEQHRRIGDVMAESRGREEDVQLKEAYQRFYNSGTMYLDRNRIQRALTSGALKLKNKRSNIAGLQLADMLAHPIKIHSLQRIGLVADLPKGFGKELIEAALPKFNRNEHTGQIDGYGRKYLLCSSE